MSAAVAPLPPGVVFWFRNDLRLHDQPALLRAALEARQRGGWLLPVFVHDPAQRALTRWGFARTTAHRRAWLASALGDLADQLEALGSRLVQPKARAPPSATASMCVANRLAMPIS